MGHLKDLFFFLILMFPSLHADINQSCPSSFCGENIYFRIQYPFKKIEDQQPQNCNYTNIKCNSSQSISSLNLPLSGDFHIRSISYYSSTVEIYDPDNCLPRRLMNNLNLQGSPFVNKDYGNSTFYNCPPQFSGSVIMAIDCLSNSTTSVVITYSISRDVMEGVHGCSLISTAKVPVSWFDFYERYGDGNSLALTWDVPECKACHKDKGLITKFLAIFILMIPAIAILLLVVFICIACCLQAVDNFTRERPGYTVARLMILYNSTTNVAGLDESRIKSCSEMVVLNNYENQMNSLENSEILCCPICLDEYCDKEKVRRLNLCRHCFHADCVDQWFRNNSTCPTCRVSLLEVIL